MLGLRFVRYLSRSSALSAPKKVEKLTVIGSGFMGSGIAQVAAQSGIKVTLVDLNDEFLKKALRGVGVSLNLVAKKMLKLDEEKAKKFHQDSLSRISTTTDTKKAVTANGGADLVIEAIVENIAIKQKLFEQLDSISRPDTILATNTSSLTLKDISVNMKNKQRFGGTHFFSPVPLMKLVEIVRTNETSPETFQALTAFGKAIGKVTVACKDTPGFIVNRLLVPYMAEAMRMVERGDATVEDVDNAMKYGAGYPMGPFTLADMVGLDVTKFIVDGWTKKYPDNPLFKSCATLDKLVAEGNFGRKTGKGFYDYKSKK
jgi:3-hydroxyacyl-CoA dehydrogenase